MHTSDNKYDTLAYETLSDMILMEKDKMIITKVFENKSDPYLQILIKRIINPILIYPSDELSNQSFTSSCKEIKIKDFSVATGICHHKYPRFFINSDYNKIKLFFEKWRLINENNAYPFIISGTSTCVKTIYSIQSLTTDSFIIKIDSIKIILTNVIA